ncbi:FAD-binding oxidoreductase [Rhodohalobacter sp.]|uniref:FAD-binding oxidoreductase n=1 Tax=Rhodohalobacter sp. TaxID=1974210 RepID=UPI002ACD36EC|nr:FAD-binding oxidoreductase [Rhodohalobacter sp.]MDZ7757535.1 FAD-binding oxidoreductase [Rhodohalobacter sp.]
MLEKKTITEFNNTLLGDIITPEDKNYDQERQVWNGLIDKYPELIVKCRGTSDVIHAVNFARENNLQVSIRGGGHNVAGLAMVDDGLVIDLSDMRGVYVDTDSKTAIVEGGATWADVDRETQLYGLAAPGGVVSTTGVAGLTLGGGLGRLRKKHGLSCDNLRSVRIVTAEGNVLTANKHENEDLFWAVRGGGGNFGVVTSFEFNLHEVGPQVMFCLPMYPIEMAEKVLSVWRDFMVSSPDEVSSEALLWSIPDVEDFPEEARGKSIVGIPAMYSGDPDEGQRVLQPLREIGEPVVDMSGQYPFAVVQTMFDWVFPKNERNYYFKSTDLSSLDDDVIKAIISKGKERPVPSMLMAIWHYGGEMNRIPAEDTAFGSRDTSFLLSVDSIWDDPADSEKVIAWSRNVLDEMKPYSGNWYVSQFPGFGEEGNELVQSAYGKNYERLAKIKAKYDPDNFFSVNLNIKPAD